LLQQALAGHDSAGIGYFHAVSLVQAGEAYLLAGQVDEARASADRALRFSRERGERGHEAWALRLLGEIAAHTDPPDVKPAEEHYRQALARGDELGMRPLVAHCHLGLGTLYRRTGDQAKAEEHLTTATTMYREMGMGFYLAQADRVSAGGDP
jgi:tetratricopeptide (TPR) repeat protein